LIRSLRGSVQGQAAQERQDKCGGRHTPGCAAVACGSGPPLVRRRMFTS
jgi:hypothetical protein